MAYTLTKAPTKSKDDEEPSSGKFKLKKPPQEPGYIDQGGRGIAQGALDLASLPALASYPIERGAQKLFGLEDTPGQMTPGVEASQQNQSNILDRLNAGERPSLSDLMDLESDEMPMPQNLGTSLSTFQEMQEQIPEGGIYQETVRRGTRSLPFLLGGPGAFSQVMRGEMAGLGAREGVKALGGGEGAQTIADITGGLIGGLNYRPKSIKAPPIAEGTGTLAKIEKNVKGPVLEKRILSLSDDVLKEADKRMSTLSQEALSDFGQFSARETEDLITKGNRASILNKVSPVEKLPKQAWEDISSAANEAFKAEKKVYSEIYEGVRNGAKSIEYAPISALEVAKNQFKKFTNIETSPAGYSQVENIVRSTIKDLSGKTVNMENFAKAWESGNVEEVAKFIENALSQKKPVTLDKLMDLGVRLGDVINYEELTPSIKDLLKPIQRAVKEDFRRGLGSKRPSLLQGFNKAEDLYKNTANRFGKDIINKLRTTENAEMMGNEFLKPSNFENLVNIFGKGNSRVSEAERQLVDLIGRQSQQTAKETFRQLEPYLSKNAKEAVQESVNLGDKLSIPGQRRLLQSNMLEDVASAVGTGQRPQFTLNAMRTPQGYQAAKDTFGRTGQGRKLFQSLEKQVVQDLFQSITQDGVIDWNKAKKILSDPGYESVMSQIMGIDGVQFIKNIEKYSKNITSNLTNSKFSEPSTFNKFYNLIDTPSKLLMASFFGNQVATLLGVVIGTKSLLQSGARVMTSPITREALRSFADPNLTGKQMMRAAMILNSVQENE